LIRDQNFIKNLSKNDDSEEKKDYTNAANAIKAQKQDDELNDATNQDCRGK